MSSDKCGYNILCFMLTYDLSDDIIDSVGRSDRQKMHFGKKYGEELEWFHVSGN